MLSTGAMLFFSASLFNFFWRWKYINDSKKENKDNTSIHHVLAECSLVPLAAMRSPEEGVRNFIKKVSKKNKVKNCLVHFSPVFAY